MMDGENSSIPLQDNHMESTPPVKEYDLKFQKGCICLFKIELTRKRGAFTFLLEQKLQWKEKKTRKNGLFLLKGP